MLRVAFSCLRSSGLVLGSSVQPYKSKVGALVPRHLHSLGEVIASSKSGYSSSQKTSRSSAAKVALAFGAIASSSAVFTEEEKKYKKLSAKLILPNGDGYFVLDDQTCWKVVGYSTRWRGIIEWWNDAKLVSEEYESVPNDWYLNTPVEVYSKHEKLQAQEANASNQEILKQCSHLFVNKGTGKLLFAVPLSPIECIALSFRDGKKAGYDQGYTQGYHESAAANYKTGRENGYEQGFSEGYRKGYRDAGGGNPPMTPAPSGPIPRRTG